MIRLVVGALAVAAAMGMAPTDQVIEPAPPPVETPPLECPPLPDLDWTGLPQVRFFPACAPVGARVWFTGTGFTDEYWEHPSIYGLGSATVYPGCELFVDLERDRVFRIGGDRLIGSFVIGGTGHCFQGVPTTDELPVLPGIYLLSVQAHPAYVGGFAITEG